jgi:hypothetical protein
MDAEILQTVIKEAVSLFVLLVVLYGVYLLTKQFIAIMSEHFASCCDSLDRIADALDRERK